MPSERNRSRTRTRPWPPSGSRGTLLERNLASKAVAEKSGLRLAWRGSNARSPDKDAIWLVYADRDLPPEIPGTLLAARR